MGFSVSWGTVMGCDTLSTCWGWKGKELSSYEKVRAIMTHFKTEGTGPLYNPPCVEKLAMPLETLAE